ncbi:protein aardvark [Anaeramoeba ignava]|uniref:Protein aardvark n=1 Tax=Anaeramoeba ignava TaxID=1746090 RepID=A0A9Q0LC56_ANAIG|nr:protein aardvark [Anaeramoeba ignava]
MTTSLILFLDRHLKQNLSKEKEKEKEKEIEKENENEKEIEKENLEQKPQDPNQELFSKLTQFIDILLKRKPQEQFDDLLFLLTQISNLKDVKLQKIITKNYIHNFFTKQIQELPKEYNKALSELVDPKKYRLLTLLINCYARDTILEILDSNEDFFKVFPIDNSDFMNRLSLTNNPDEDEIFINKFIHLLSLKKKYPLLEKYFDYGLPLQNADEYYEEMIENFEDNEDEIKSNFDFSKHFVNFVFNHLFISTKDEDEIMTLINILMHKCLTIAISEENMAKRETEICEIIEKITIICSALPQILQITSSILNERLLYVSSFLRADQKIFRIVEATQKLIVTILQRFKNIDNGHLTFGNAENKISRMISYSVQEPFRYLAEINENYKDINKHIQILNQTLKSPLIWESKLAVIEKFIDVYLDDIHTKIPVSVECVIESLRCLRMFPLKTLPSILLLLTLIARGSDNKKLFSEKRGIQTILEIMQANEKNIQLQIWGIKAIWGMAQYSMENRDIITEFEGLKVILNVMAQFPHEPELHSNACATLWILSTSEQNRNDVSKNNGIHVILQSMNNHLKNTELQTNACGVLWNLSVNDENKKSIIDNDGIKIILHSLITHKMDESVQKYACGVLANIASLEDHLEALKTSELLGHLNWINEQYSENHDVLKQQQRLYEKLSGQKENF